MPKLKYFALKTSVKNDLQIKYLKWLLNNVNYIIKLKIDVRIDQIWATDQTKGNSVVDANFIRQYCLPDHIINLKDFRFYVRLKHESTLKIDISKIINSFKIDPVFISHEWTNVSCVYDEYESYQHIFSANLKRLRFYNLLR